MKRITNPAHMAELEAAREERQRSNADPQPEWDGTFRPEKRSVFAVLNTFGKTPTHAGYVLSSHYTLEAAEAAEAKLQRRIPGTGYLPIKIVELDRLPRRGEWIRRSEIEE